MRNAKVGVEQSGTWGVPLKLPPQDIHSLQGNSYESKILEFSIEPRSLQEILTYLGLNDRKNLWFVSRFLQE
jgi:hypothetical protein